MHLTNGVVIGEEEKPGVGAGPSPHADPPTKGHGDVYWIAAAVVCDLIAFRVRGPLAAGPRPSPHAHPPTKGHGDGYWIAAAGVVPLIAAQVRGPLDDSRPGSVA